MSKVKLTLPLGEIPVNGKQITFTAPCPCYETEAIQIDGVDYTICDAMGRCVTGQNGAWDAGEIVSVVLNVDARKAYILNKAGNPLFTATVTTSWTESGTYFYQDIPVEGILETDTPIVDINPGSDNAANVAYSQAIGKVFRITTSANSIRVWAVSKPAVAFPIQIKVVR